MSFDEEPFGAGVQPLGLVVGDLDRELEPHDQRIATLVLRDPLLPGLVADGRFAFRVRKRPWRIIQPRACRQSLHGDHGVSRTRTSLRHNPPTRVGVYATHPTEDGRGIEFSGQLASFAVRLVSVKTHFAEVGCGGVSETLPVRRVRLDLWVYRG